MNFIKLTHFSTGNVTYLKSEDITSVSQGFDRTLVICNNGQGAHYREGAEYIMDLIHGETYPPAVERGEPTQADFEMGHVAGVCDLGPLPIDIKNVPLYQVVAHWDTNAHREIEITTYENRLDAIDCFNWAMQDFQDTITQGGLDLNECDFENKDDELPTVYMQDSSGEGSIRISVREVTVQ
jgi:hypothetical protein